MRRLLSGLKPKLDWRTKRCRLVANKSSRSRQETPLNESNKKKSPPPCLKVSPLFSGSNSYRKNTGSSVFFDGTFVGLENWVKLGWDWYWVEYISIKKIVIKKFVFSYRTNSLDLKGFVHVILLIVVNFYFFRFKPDFTSFSVNTFKSELLRKINILLVRKNYCEILH